MNNKSPLRYPGGKSRACKIIEETINTTKSINRYDTILSPFFGGGSFEFYLQNKYNMQIIANDKFEPLFNFWSTVKYDKNNLVKTINQLKPVSKDQFAQYRKDVIDKNINSLLRAAYYFIINRCSFSGATLSGGFSKESSEKRFTQNSIDNINNLDLKNVIFENKDFLQFIGESKIALNTLLFLDPPYYLSNPKLYGDNGDLHEYFNHQQLADILKKYKGWVLCYNDCEFIRKLYDNYDIFEVNWSYGMNTSKESSEIIILNL